MARRRARECALQVLYTQDQTGDDAGAALRAYWAQPVEGVEGADTRPIDSEEMSYCDKLVRGVESQRAALDALIEGASQHWRLPRMPVVDRNILRLAAYELVHCHDVPASACIDEGVEIAKRYGDKDSRAFVNGILDRIAAEVGRGGRRTRP